MSAKTSKQQYHPAELAELIGKLSLSKRAERVLSIDVRGLTSLTDFFVICSAETNIQVKAIADAIRKGTATKPWHIEGYAMQQWILLDYVDVVVHIFLNSVRDFYLLEKLWADAPIKEIIDEVESKTD
ncbi:ribosome silencing factor [Candidatus Neomarinimicrobiota bacterium]